MGEQCPQANVKSIPEVKIKCQAPQGQLITTPEKPLQNILPGNAKPMHIMNVRSNKQA